MKKAILLILDGWGLGQVTASDAIAQARTPVMDELIASRPSSTLITFGDEVGLPQGQMGNSEVGHMNIGAGRIVYQDLLKIDRDIESGAFQKQAALVDMCSKSCEKGNKLHLIGLVSDGGVHSHIAHLFALIDLAETHGLKNVHVHAFMDGRDTDPQAGLKYLTDLLDYIEDKETSLSSVIGRYFAMDRDRRWQRTGKAYDLLVNGKGEPTTDVLDTINKRYAAGETDEFLEPIVCNPDGQIADGDTVLFFNFRADRPRQLTTMLTLQDFVEYGTVKLDLDFYSMTPYDETFTNVEVVYDKSPLSRTFGELIAELGGSQLRMAETEKYPHVTYFFSGGREDTFPGERRILVDSPKVATYDLQPSMSAVELTDALLADLEQQETDFICLNFANTDMVGHTGVFQAAMQAAEIVDSCIGRILDVALPMGYQILIIADHGNSDYMINKDGSPNTAHSKNPVPCIYVHPDHRKGSIKTGILADVAPTLAKMMNIDPYPEMTGQSLIEDE